MARTLVAALLLCAGCGREGDASRSFLFRVERAVSPVFIPEGYVDPELRPLLDAFLADAAMHDAAVALPDRLRLELIGAETAPLLGEAGTCSRRWIRRDVSGVQIDIRIVRLTRALTARPMAFRLAAYHELGHCLLGLSHAAARSGESIMSPRFPGNVAFTDAAWAALVAELFGGPPG
jgi:hypothetical protein